MSSAWVLLVVGMLTVFTVLSLVVIGSQGLIRVVNILAPTPTHVQPPMDIPASHIAAVAAAVATITADEGRLDRIQRIDNSSSSDNPHS